MRVGSVLVLFFFVCLTYGQALGKLNYQLARSKVNSLRFFKQKDSLVYYLSFLESHFPDSLITSDHWLLGRVYKDQEDFQTSSYHLRHCVEGSLSDMPENQILARPCFNDLAEAYLAMGRYQKIFEILEERNERCTKCYFVDQHIEREQDAYVKAFAYEGLNKTEAAIQQILPYIFRDIFNPFFEFTKEKTKTRLFIQLLLQNHSYAEIENMLDDMVESYRLDYEILPQNKGNNTRSIVQVRATAWFKGMEVVLREEGFYLNQNQSLEEKLDTYKLRYKKYLIHSLIYQEIKGLYGMAFGNPNTIWFKPI